MASWKWWLWNTRHTQHQTISRTSKLFMRCLFVWGFFISGELHSSYSFFCHLRGEEKRQMPAYRYSNWLDNFYIVLWERLDIRYHTSNVNICFAWFGLKMFIHLHGYLSSHSIGFCSLYSCNNLWQCFDFVVETMRNFGSTVWKNLLAFFFLGNWKTF